MEIQKALDVIDVIRESSVEICKRRLLDDDNPDGYLESNKDFVLNNLDVAVVYLENYEEINFLLQKVSKLI